MHIIICI